MPRKVEEWIGRSDDHRAPKKVRDRILLREPCCYLCTLPVDGTKKWDLDHVKALINGGENRESNLRPVHRKCHTEKTAQDVAEKAKVAAVRQKHLGITAPKQKIPGRPFPASAKSPRPKKDDLPPLPRRQLFREVTT